MKHVCVLGAGSMGTALALLAERGGSRVRLWGRDPATMAEMARSRENTRHLAGVPLPEALEVTSDAGHAAADAELLIVAIPSAFLRATLTRIAGAIPAGVPVVSVVKGIERGSFARPSQIVVEVLGDRPVAVLSGPSHAEEFARGLPASVVVASSTPEVGVEVRETLRSDTFRVYHNADLLGVELAGALKNVLGIAAGICEGLGFGDNAKAALLTRGLVEIARFAVDMGARMETFWGLAGVGDVLTTCYSGFGRNRAVGLKIGKGMTLNQALAGMHDVAEGVFTTQSVFELARGRGIEMPITAELHAILFDSKDPRSTVTDLMLRGPKPE